MTSLTQKILYLYASKLPFAQVSTSRDWGLLFTLRNQVCTLRSLWSFWGSFCLRGMRLTVTDKTVTKIMTLCQEFLFDKQFLICQITYLIGTLVSLSLRLNWDPCITREKNLAVQDASRILKTLCLCPQKGSQIYIRGFPRFLQRTETLIMESRMLL